jgi:hypothetical protein
VVADAFAIRDVIQDNQSRNLSRIGISGCQDADKSAQQGKAPISPDQAGHRPAAGIGRIDPMGG